MDNYFSYMNEVSNALTSQSEIAGKKQEEIQSFNNEKSTSISEHILANGLLHAPINKAVEYAAKKIKGKIEDVAVKKLKQLKQKAEDKLSELIEKARTSTGSVRKELESKISDAKNELSDAKNKLLSRKAKPPEKVEEDQDPQDEPEQPEEQPEDLDPPQPPREQPKLDTGEAEEGENTIGRQGSDSSARSNVEPQQASEKPNLDDIPEEEEEDPIINKTLPDFDNLPPSTQPPPPPPQPPNIPKPLDEVQEEGDPVSMESNQIGLTLGENQRVGQTSSNIRISGDPANNSRVNPAPNPDPDPDPNPTVQPTQPTIQGEPTVQPPIQGEPTVQAPKIEGEDPVASPEAVGSTLDSSVANEGETLAKQVAKKAIVKTGEKVGEDIGEGLSDLFDPVGILVQLGVGLASLLPSMLRKNHPKPLTQMTLNPASAFGESE